MTEYTKEDYAKAFARSWLKIIGWVVAFCAFAVGGTLAFGLVVAWPTMLGEYVVHGSVWAKEPLPEEWHIIQWAYLGLLFTFALAWVRMEVDEDND